MDAPTNSWSYHLKATLTLSLPLIGGHLAQVMIGLTDTVMMGWHGVTTLAAGVLATSVYLVFFLVGSGFAFAAMPMAAEADGAGDDVQVRRVVRMALWITIIYCALVMPVLWNFRTLMLLLGQEEPIAQLAQDYMRLAQWAMFPALLLMVLRSYLAALERVNWVLAVTIVSATLNAAANFAFIFGNWGAPEMGIRGAAIASLASTMLGFLLVATYAHLHPKLQQYALFIRLWRPDWGAFWQVFRLGWPIGATMLAEVGMFSAGAVLMGWIGTVELATHGIALQIASLAFMVYLGVANAATVRAGRALGRRDLAGIWRVTLVAFGLQVAAGLIVILPLLSIPDVLLGAFLDLDAPDSAAIMSYGVGLLVITAMFQLPDGLQVVALAVLRGVQDTRIPMVLAVVSYWVVGMPVSYLLGIRWGYGGEGVWLGLVFGLTLASTTMIARFVWIMRRGQVLPV